MAAAWMIDRDYKPIGSRVKYKETTDLLNLCEFMVPIHVSQPREKRYTLTSRSEKPFSQIILATGPEKTEEPVVKILPVTQ